MQMLNSPLLCRSLRNVLSLEMHVSLIEVHVFVSNQLKFSQLSLGRCGLSVVKFFRNMNDNSVPMQTRFGQTELDSCQISMENIGRLCVAADLSPLAYFVVIESRSSLGFAFEKRSPCAP